MLTPTYRCIYIYIYPRGLYECVVKQINGFSIKEMPALLPSMSLRNLFLGDMDCI